MVKARTEVKECKIQQVYYFVPLFFASAFMIALLLSIAVAVHSVLREIVVVGSYNLAGR